MIHRGWRCVVAACLLVVSVVAVPSTASWAVDAVPGSAGTDTSLPLTDSHLTVSGRGRFADLTVSVNQTRKLVNQAISVTWAGGTPTKSFPGPEAFGEHFLQMFQCWGDDDGSNPGNPGPPPEQCQQGATNGVYGGSPTGRLFQGNTSTRVISQRGDPSFDPARGTLDEFGAVSLPFRAVDGTVVPQWRDTSFNPQIGGGDYWLNDYFNIITTNEVAGSRTSPAGTGAELFEATTGLESSGLGCGQKVQKQPDGASKAPRCWLVVVPRGSTTDENRGHNLDPALGVGTSPLTPAVWQNRIAVPLEFNPVETSCPLSADQRRIVGSELLSGAVASWQPALCATPGLSPYAYSAISDGQARQQLLSGVPGAPGMAVVSRPVDAATVDARNPVVYAPLSLSGIVIGFNVERRPEVSFPQGEKPPEEVLEAAEKLAGVRVAQLHLTPRLVAKLLTQSYRLQVEIGASKPPYPWTAKNPLHLDADPDFLQFNPEFRLLQTPSKNMSGLVLPSPNSDAALQVWEWVLSDPEAKLWLAGTADPWGMNVNPVYSTSPSVNPQGTSFGDPLPDSYPKSDPYCFQGPDIASGRFVTTPPPLCGLDWLPYAQSLRDAARATRAANDGAKTVVDIAAISPDQVYKSDGPQGLGSRSILSMTDTASAAQYGVQAARLSRAGDNAVDRRFVAPDQAGLAAGGAALAAKGDAGFLEPSPSTTPPDAYPLTALTYAAVTPIGLDATARREYAAFVDYAAGPGQEPGFEYGQLPAGYQPLPEHMRAQAKAAATLIRDLTVADVPEEPLTTSEPPTAGETPSDVPAPEASADEPAVEQVPGAGAATPGPGTGPAALPRPKASAIDKVIDAATTRAYRLAATRYALPVLVVVALLAALGALELTKRRSRTGPSPDGLVQPDTG